MKLTPSIDKVAALVVLVALVAAGGAGGAGPSGNSEPPLRQWDQLFSVQCLRSPRCFAAGSKGLLLTSADSGQTWMRHIVRETSGSALRQDLDLYCVRFGQAGRKGWIVGEDGLVMRTVDGGLSWQRQNSPVRERLFKVALSTPDSACAVGVNGSLICTADAGAHWQLHRLGDLALYDVTFIDASNGWAVGEFETILHTGDGGRSWQIQHGGSRASSIPPYFALAFRDRSHGMAFGQGGVSVATADAGANWRDTDAVAEARSVFAALYSDRPSQTVLWVAGTGGSILERESGGQWRTYRALAAHDLTDVAISGDWLVAVGMNGTIVRRQTDDLWLPVVVER